MPTANVIPRRPNLPLETIEALAKFEKLGYDFASRGRSVAIAFNGRLFTHMRGDDTLSPDTRFQDLMKRAVEIAHNHYQQRKSRG